MEKKSIFNFMGDGDETATGGNLEETLTDPEEDVPVDPGPPKIHQGLTKDQIFEAQKRAESPRGLDISKFLNEVGLPSLNIEQLLAFRIPE